MAHVVMAHIVVAYVVMAHVVVAYVVMAHIVVAHIVVAHIGTAHIVRAHIVMALVQSPDLELGLGDDDLELEVRSSAARSFKAISYSCGLCSYDPWNDCCLLFLELDSSQR